ncbi:MAG: hypothetical protein ACXW6K_13090 [Candidatus Binatia bacterium]
MASQLLNQRLRHVQKHVDKFNGGKLTMLKKLWGAMLIVALFALAGCPEVSQQGSGGSSEKMSGGD